VITSDVKGLAKSAQRMTEVLGGDHPDTVRAIARVCVRAIDEDLWGHQRWVPRPVELPDNDDELRDVASSKKAADKDLRRAILAWKWSNEKVENDAAEKLRVCVLNFVDLERLRAQGDEEAQKLQERLWIHCKRTFNADVSVAKADRDTLDRWCHRAVAVNNPVPVWLRLGERSKTFTPRRSSAPEKVGNVIPLFEEEDD
jgi:hypothetical protein